MKYRTFDFCFHNRVQTGFQYTPMRNQVGYLYEIMLIFNEKTRVIGNNVTPPPPPDENIGAATGAPPPPSLFWPNAAAGSK